MFEYLLPHVPAWLMVLFRITGIFIMGPMFGSTTIPPKVKIFLAAGIAFAVYPMLLSPDRQAAWFVFDMIDHGMHMWMLIPMIASELLIGFLIGYGATLPIIGFQMAGRVIDQQLGLGIAGIYNPEIDDQSGMVDQFYFMLGLALFVIVGGHRIMLITLLGTFDQVPLGSFMVSDQTLLLITGLLQAMVDIAVRVAGPLLCIIFLMTVGMGFIARTVPQMNILSIGFPLRILLGLFILTASISVEANAYTEALHISLQAIQGYFNDIAVAQAHQSAMY